MINLSEKLTEKYGEGWSVEQLTLIRKFYMTYSKFVNTDYEIQNSDLGIAEHTAANALRISDFKQEAELIAPLLVALIQKSKYP